MKQSVDISRASMADVDGIAAIEKGCFSHPWTKEQFQSELSQPYARLLAAKCGESVCGYLDMHIVAHSACINNIAVAREYRGRGVGHALMCHAVRQAKAEHCEEIALEVRQSNLAAQGLYQKLGFRAAGIRRDFYRDPPEDGITMLLILEENNAYIGN